MGPQQIGQSSQESNFFIAFYGVFAKKYTSADGSYILFKERNENEARQLYGDN